MLKKIRNVLSLFLVLAALFIWAAPAWAEEPSYVELTPCKYANIMWDYEGHVAIVEERVIEERNGDTIMTGRWGIVDQSGQEIVPCVCDTTLNYTEGYFRGHQGNLFGCYDSAGKVAIPFQYEGLGYFYEGLAVAALNGKYGFIDQANNTVIPFQYEDATSFSGGLASVKKTEGGGLSTDREPWSPPSGTSSPLLVRMDMY